MSHFWILSQTPPIVESKHPERKKQSATLEGKKYVTVGQLVNSVLFFSDEGWLEQGFWATESLGSDGDDLTVGKLFFDVTHNFSFSTRTERVTTLGQNLHHVPSQVTSGKIQTENGMRK